MEQASTNSTIWIGLSNLHNIAKSFSSVTATEPVQSEPVPSTSSAEDEPEDRKIRFNVAFSDDAKKAEAGRKANTTLKKNMQESRTEYEKRLECINYLKWLVDMNDRFEGIVEETEEYLEKFRRHQQNCDHVDYLAIQEGNQLVRVIEQFIQTEFLPFHIFSLDASEKFPSHLLKLVYPEEEENLSLCNTNHTIWQTWCNHKPSDLPEEGEIPSLHSLFHGIHGFLQVKGVLLEEHDTQEMGTGWNSDESDEPEEEYSSSERVHAANESFQYALRILEQATQIEQIAIQILGSAASHRVNYSGQIFITLASPLYLLLDRQFQDEADRQRVDIVSARSKFPLFLKSLDRIFLSCWLLLSVLMRPYQRQQVAKTGKKEPHTSLEFLYGKVYPKLMMSTAGRTGTKKMKIFPGVEAKTVMAVVKRMWGKMDSHLALCLQNFSLRSTKGNHYDAASIRVLFVLLQNMVEFFGSAGGPLFPLYHQCVQNGFHKVRSVYSIMKEFQSLQFVAKLFCDQIAPTILPENEHWKRYCATTLWKEGAPSDECFSQFKSLFDQFCLLLIGSKGAATAQIGSYLTVAIDTGVGHPSYRDTIQQIQQLLSQSLPQVSMNLFSRISESLYRIVTSADTQPTVNVILSAHCRSALQAPVPSAASPAGAGTAKSKMLQMV